MMTPQEQPTDDVLATRLATISQHILVVVFGLLPIFFIPSVSTPFTYSKVLFVAMGMALAIILYSFSVLRSGSIRVQFSWPPVILWIIALVALVSAFLSGDIRDAFLGETFEVHTAVFVALLALTTSVWMILSTNKNAVMRLFMFLAGSTLLLSLFHIVRLIFGAQIFSFGLFSSDPTLSPLGGWNDLAIFFGLTIMLSLVALEQLRLTRVGQILFGMVVVTALVMLAVINFFAVWMVLGIISLAVIIYGLMKDRVGGQQGVVVATSKLSLVSIYISLAVLVMSIVFTLGGSLIGNAVSNLAGISYLEVRPSFTATMDIAKQVYGTDLLFGAGPNRFVDMWRQFKDPSINESIFWSTNFIAGFGYIPTFFVTIGLLGGIAWIAFLVLFAITGLRMLLYTESDDRIWYFIGTTSFVGGLYIWGISLIYVPGPVLLLLGALCTGLMCVSANTLMQKEPQVLSSIGNRRASFILIALFLVLVIGSVSGSYLIGRQYMGVYLFNTSLAQLATGASLDDVEARTVQAYLYSSDDAFARRIAEYQIARLNNLLATENPTEEQRQQFNNTLVSAVNAAQTAVAGDSSNPDNVGTLGIVYATLVPAKIEGAYDRAKENLVRAQELDPRNPLRLLALGQLAFAAGKTDEARGYIDRAVAMKTNYSDAIFFRAQMDIAAGNIEAAIAASRATTVLEPQNPVRFFQLGVLLFSNKQFADSAVVLERAVALDNGYANARFYLALDYDMLRRSDDARSQLSTILASNPGNELILGMLERLERGQSLVQEQRGAQPLSESTDVKEGDGSVTTSTKPDTPLVSPVNTPNQTEETPSAP